MILKNGKPRIVDLFGGAGGAAKGLQRAGFWVIGVDIAPQPDYCGDDFIQMDAFKFLKRHRRMFDFIWASPPCQDFSRLTLGNRAKGLFDNHVNLIPRTRKMLRDSGRPFVIENVGTAPLRKDLELCGLMFDLPLFRHRVFELHGFEVPQPRHVSHAGRRVRGYRHGEFYGGDIIGVYGSGGGKGELRDWQRAMGIDWTSSWHSLAEAVPPVYSELIGRHMIKLAGM